MTSSPRSTDFQRAFVGWRVIAPFALAVALLAGLGVASVEILSAMRAYVAGESLWSKGQRDAAMWLREYVVTRDEGAYQRFELALQVPLGDREARLELDKPQPDFARAADGFLRGGNHPDDIPSLIRMYRLFRDVPLMSDPIDIWAQGDDSIVELRRLAAELHAQGGGLDPASRTELQADIEDVSVRVDRLEQNFSARLGVASRITQTLLSGMTLVLAAVLFVMGALFARRTLRRLADSEQAARASSARWVMATEAAAIGMFDWDPTIKEILLDARSAAIFGIEAPPGLGLADADLHFTQARLMASIHPEDRQRVDETSREALDKQTPWRLRVRVCHADRSVHHVEIHARLSGERMLGVVREVTREVQADQLRLDKQAAERASAAKSEFLSRASHELRTPLNAIIGFTQMMQGDTSQPLPMQQAQRLRHVLQGGRYLLKLVNDMLDLGGIEQGALAMQPQRVDMADVLTATIGLLEPLRLAQNVRIDNLVTAREALVRADATRLEQVFVNLIGNAIKYNREGGSVLVRTLARVEGQVCIEVRDTGIGMTAEQTAQLFQPFNRLGAEYSGVDGAGLGLVVSRQLLERSGGRIEVRSEVGVGTSVLLWLPGFEASAQRNGAHSSAAA